jgi:two-component system cell cycle response regulator
MRSGNRARILVIEDNETNRELMTYLLRAFDYETLEAGDGENGVELARHERPELIVCDVHLPKLDGFGVVGKLKSDNALRDIPVVAVTALAMVGDRNRILAAGFDGYVSKPIAPETFVQDIEKYLPPERRSRVEHRIVAVAVGSESESSRHSSPGSLGTLLIVDDVAANLGFARSTLEPSGYAVLTADSVAKALTLTLENKPDLVLCDLHMHPQGGLDLLDHVKRDSALQSIPVVIISSTATGTYDERECLDHGAVNFIRRPIEPEALLAEVAKTLHESRQK